MSVPAWAGPLTLPGSLDVTADGAAAYSIPISVLPGTSGMAPVLSLDYSSQSGNGLEGVGWSLSGLPSIGRCPKTVAQDLVKGSVNYDANDRFCMEGQRLVAISGTYGADGSEYRTEIEGFSKIVAHGTAGNGPSWFEVHTKSGQTMEFGNTGSSRILAQGKTTARSWAVDKITDTKGNYLTVTYTNDATNGQAYPARIDYTGNTAAGLTPYNSVQFVYETRPDIVPLYHAGSLQKTTVRLTDIQTYSGTTLVDDYKLAYQQDGRTGNSEAVSVKLCAAGTTDCLPPSVFSWNDSGGALTNGLTDQTVGTNTWNGYNIITGDFDGSGRTSILLQGKTSGASSYLYLADHNNHGTLTQSGNAISGWDATKYDILAGDFRGKGKTDLVLIPKTCSGSNCDLLFTFTSPGFMQVGSFTGYSIQPYTSGGLAYSYLFFLGDFDGDGRTDIGMAEGVDDGYGDGYVFFTSISVSDSGAITSTPAMQTNGGDLIWLFPSTTSILGEDLYVSDLNGDGKADLIVVAQQNNGFHVTQAVAYLSTSGMDAECVVLPTGQSCDSATNLDPEGWTSGNVKLLLGDWNGDGKTDILSYVPGSSTATGTMYLNKGDGSFVATGYNPIGWGNYDLYTGDFNGLGRTSVMAVASCSGCASHIYDSTGTAFTARSYAPTDWYGSYFVTGDWNGHGVSSLMRVVASSGQATEYASSTSPSLISDFQSATAGSTLATSVTYKPLTDASVYTKDTGASYPTVDVAGPMYVVSEVDAANGVGGTYASTYAYAGARADISGRGFLGFRQRTVTDPQTGIVQTTTYDQSFPAIGLVASETRKLGSQLLNATSNAYTATNLGGTRNFVPLTGSVASSWDLDGTALPVVTSGYTYDAYGNATQVTVSTPDGASKVTTNTYTNDTTNWILGRLTAASVTSTVPDAGGSSGGSSGNQPPVAANDDISLPWNGGSFDPRTNDYDPDGDPLTITAVSTPTHGTASIDGSGTSVTYAPASGYSGADSFTYTISDGQGHTATATVNSTTTANQSPVATDDTVSLPWTGGSFDPRTNDYDADGDTLTITAVSTPGHGTASIGGSGTSVTYTPASGYSGADSFTYTISDGHGNTATATVSVTVAPNQPPVAVDDSITVAHGTSHSVTFDPRANDSDPDGDTLTITSVTQPSKGTVTILSGGTQLKYTAPSTTGTFTFTYTISDGNGHTATATVTAHVT